MALETSVIEFTRHKEKLETHLAAQAEHCSDLQAALEDQKAPNTAIEHEFEIYKK